MLRIFTFLLCSLFFVCCGGSATAPAVSTEKPTFEMITIPGMITSPEQRAEYLGDHYWDNFDFNDTAYIDLAEVTEQAYSNYVHTLSMIDTATADRSMSATMTKAEADSAMYAYFVRLGERYLYDPNSPLRNETLYIPVIKSMMSSKWTDPAGRIRPAYQMTMIRKNRPGIKATDFGYTTPTGRTGSLHSIRSPYTLIYFYNPDCENCRQVREMMIESSIITSLEKSDSLQILAIYPDKDLEIWIQHQAEIPNRWINGYDRETTIECDTLYNLRAIPSLYLLDRNKVVILKDAPLSNIEQYLYRERHGGTVTTE